MRIPTTIFFILYILITSCGTSRKTPTADNPIIVFIDTVQAVKSSPAYSLIQQKYAKQLSVEPEMIRNVKLYQFIDGWMHTPYLWGGMSKRGIDCSALIQRLLSEVYNIEIPRTSVQQFFTQRIEPYRSKAYLKEGDLVFFRTLENTYISHVGLFLHNDKFINSSTSKGVSIASLNDPYWKKRYVAAGRIKPGYKFKY